MSKSSTEILTGSSTICVDKFGIRTRVRSTDPQTPENQNVHGQEVNEFPSLAQPVRLPTLDARIELYERAGLARQAFFDAMYDPETGRFMDGLPDDEFLDSIDDIDEDGISPHELKEHELHITANISRAERAKAKKAAEEAAAASKAKPPASESQKTE